MTDMEKREKVIKGLECCVKAELGITDEHGFACNSCPYQDLGTICHTYTKAQMLKDAIALLKAQEPQATTPEAEWLIFKGKRGATCSYCKRTFYDVYDVENYDYYCRRCGARMVKIRTVKWE